MESGGAGDYDGVASGEFLLVPAEVFEEDLAEGIGGVVDVCSNASVAFALNFEAFDADSLAVGERSANVASEAGGEVCEQVHAAKLRRDWRSEA